MALHQQIHYGHAYGHAHFHLFLNDRPVDVICQSSINFHASVHRAGVHDDGIGFGMAQLFRVQSEAMVILSL